MRHGFDVLAVLLSGALVDAAGAFLLTLSILAGEVFGLPLPGPLNAWPIPRFSPSAGS